MTTNYSFAFDSILSGGNTAESGNANTNISVHRKRSNTEPPQHSGRASPTNFSLVGNKMNSRSSSVANNPNNSYAGLVTSSLTELPRQTTSEDFPFLFNADSNVTKNNNRAVSEELMSGSNFFEPDSVAPQTNKNGRYATSSIGRNSNANVTVPVSDYDDLLYVAEGMASPNRPKPLASIAERTPAPVLLSKPKTNSFAKTAPPSTKPTATKPTKAKETTTTTANKNTNSNSTSTDVPLLKDDTDTTQIQHSAEEPQRRLSSLNSINNNGYSSSTRSSGANSSRRKKDKNSKKQEVDAYGYGFDVGLSVEKEPLDASTNSNASARSNRRRNTIDVMTSGDADATTASGSGYYNFYNTSTSKNNNNNNNVEDEVDRVLLASSTTRPESGRRSKKSATPPSLPLSSSRDGTRIDRGEEDSGIAGKIGAATTAASPPKSKEKEGILMNGSSSPTNKNTNKTNAAAGAKKEETTKESKQKNLTITTSTATPSSPKASSPKNRGNDEADDGRRYSYGEEFFELYSPVMSPITTDKNDKKKKRTSQENDTAAPTTPTATPTATKTPTPTTTTTDSGATTTGSPTKKRVGSGGNSKKKTSTSSSAAPAAVDAEEEEAREEFLELVNKINEQVGPADAEKKKEKEGGKDAKTPTTATPTADAKTKKEPRKGSGKKNSKSSAVDEEEREGLLEMVDQLNEHLPTDDAEKKKGKDTSTKTPTSATSADKNKKTSEEEKKREKEEEKLEEMVDKLNESLPFDDGPNGEANAKKSQQKDEKDYENPLLKNKKVGSISGKKAATKVTNIPTPPQPETPVVTKSEEEKKNTEDSNNNKNNKYNHIPPPLFNPAGVNNMPTLGTDVTPTSTTTNYSFTHFAPNNFNNNNNNNNANNLSNTSSNDLGSSISMSFSGNRSRRNKQMSEEAKYRIQMEMEEAKRLLLMTQEGTMPSKIADTTTSAMDTSQDVHNMDTMKDASKNASKELKPMQEPLPLPPPPPPSASLLVPKAQRVFTNVKAYEQHLKEEHSQPRRQLKNNQCQADWVPPETNYEMTLQDIENELEGVLGILDAAEKTEEKKIYDSDSESSGVDNSEGTPTTKNKKKKETKEEREQRLAAEDERLKQVAQLTKRNDNHNNALVPPQHPSMYKNPDFKVKVEQKKRAHSVEEEMLDVLLDLQPTAAGATKVVSEGSTSSRENSKDSQHKEHLLITPVAAAGDAEPLRVRSIDLSLSKHNKMKNLVNGTASAGSPTNKDSKKSPSHSFVVDEVEKKRLLRNSIDQQQQQQQSGSNNNNNNSNPGSPSNALLRSSVNSLNNSAYLTNAQQHSSMHSRHGRNSTTSHRSSVTTKELACPSTVTFAPEVEFYGEEEEDNF